MTRGQRGAHAIIWSVLAIILALTMFGALAARDRIDRAAQSQAQTQATDAR
jgi:hypothetical protein